MADFEEVRSAAMLSIMPSVQTKGKRCVFQTHSTVHVLSSLS